MLSMAKPADKPWRKMDVIYPILGAIAFAVSANLRKAGLDVVNIPILAAATTASTAALFSLGLLKFQGEGDFQAAAPECRMADHRRHYQYGGDAVGVLCLELWQSRDCGTPGQF